MKAFYFYGCWNGETGHYLHEMDGRTIALDTPFGGDLDGGIQPANKNPCRGRGLPHESIVYRDGWTALAFWDQTVDTRPGSCGVFLCDKICLAHFMREEAERLFPQIWQRLHARDPNTRTL